MSEGTGKTTLEEIVGSEKDLILDYEDLRSID